MAYGRLVLLYVGLVLGSARAQGVEQAQGSSRRLWTSVKPWRAGVNRSLELANLHSPQNLEDRSARLAVLLLSASAKQSCCALQNFADNLAPSTPIDIYLFSKQNALEQPFKELGCSHAATFHSLNFMALDEHWETPEEADEPELWTSPFNDEYRRMGHWRLTFQMEFAAKLGYKYILQLDDDSKFPSPIDFNLVQYMLENRKVMASRQIHDQDPIQVILGAAELARYFLVTEQIQPTTLYQYCTPANISGLYTPTALNADDIWGAPQNGGYQSAHVYGNFVIIDLDFWFEPIVQRFVRLVLGTGGHFRFRWNEQLVQSLVWQIFVKPEHFDVFEFPYTHPDKC